MAHSMHEEDPRSSRENEEIDSLNAVLFFEAELVKHFRRCVEGGIYSQDGRESCFRNFDVQVPLISCGKFFLMPIVREMAENPGLFVISIILLFNNFVKQGFPLPSPPQHQLVAAYGAILCTLSVAMYMCTLFIVMEST